MKVKKVKVEEADAGDLRRIRFTRAKVPYGIIKTIVEKDKIAVVSGISRQTAYYIRKKLSRMIGTKVESIPAHRDGEKVYLFMKKDLYSLESLRE